MTLMTLENVEVLKEIVECEVANDLFTDFIEGGQGFGTMSMTRTFYNGEKDEMIYGDDDDFFEHWCV